MVACRSVGWSAGKQVSKSVCMYVCMFFVCGYVRTHAYVMDHTLCVCAFVGRCRGGCLCLCVRICKLNSNTIVKTVI